MWKLLEQAPPRTAGPRFTADTVRAARLAGQAGGAWWQRLLHPVPLAAGSLAAAAALAFAVLSLREAAPPSNPLPGETVAVSQGFSADQQAVVEEEALIAAVDNLDAFTDSELVSLLGL